MVGTCGAEGMPVKSGGKVAFSYGKAKGKSVA